MTQKIAHLEFIQEVIKRMSTNSFLIKGWTVTLVSALFVVTVTTKDAQPLFVLLAYFPAIALWILDAYYLHQERLFKKLYDEVRLPDSTVKDFSMDTSRYEGASQSWRQAMLSKTLLIFHGCILVAIMLVMLSLLLLR